MKRVVLVMVSLLLIATCANPTYAKRHLNKEARAAQKRNKTRDKALKHELRARQKANKKVDAKRQH